MIWYVRWRDHASEDGPYLHGRWRGQWERDGSLRIYELDPKARYENHERRSRATRSLREDIIYARTVGPRNGEHWAPFTDALDALTENVA